MAEHQQGLNETCYTHDRRPVQLVFHTAFNDIIQGIKFEKQVKGWSREKEAIIKDQWENLIKLSANTALRQAQGDTANQEY